MIQGYEVAKYELFMISDSGLRSKFLSPSRNTYFTNNNFQWKKILCETWLLV